jgi:hypothetical protein
MEVKALNDLGKRIAISEAQSRAVSAWWEAFKRVKNADTRLHNAVIDAAAAEYVKFSDEITHQALDADEATQANQPEATHVVLADIAKWQRLRRVLETIEINLGDQWSEFLAWARSAVPQRAHELLALSDLEQIE